MDDLFPDILKEYIKDPSKIVFDMNISKEISASLVMNDTRVLFILKKNEPIDAKVKRLIHELTYFHPKFIAYIGGRYQNPSNVIDSVERQIYEQSKRVYEFRPDIVQFLEEKIRLAESHHDQRKRFKDVFSKCSARNGNFYN